VRRKSWAVLALVPSLLSGCTALGLSSTTGSGGSSSSGGSAQPSGPSWVVVAPGSATPSARPSYPAAPPTPATASGFLPLGRPAPTGTPSVACSPNTFKFSKIATASAAPSTTSAVVSWYNVGGTTLKEFRVTAISQDLVSGKQRDVGFISVPPTTLCGQMSATITGLDRATGYVFSVDAVVARRSGEGTHAATVARSHVVYTS
jgi:hypothetical protein